MPPFQDFSVVGSEFFTGLRPELTDLALSGLYLMPDLRFTGLRHALGNLAPSGLISRRIRIPPGYSRG